MSNYMWILDPGHGSRDFTSGKRSPVWPNGSQYFEGEGNRKIALKVGKTLSTLNIKHTYTAFPCEPEDMPLGDRTDLINELQENNKIVISIHSDGFSKPSAHGWSVFTSPGRTASDDIATRFYLEAKKVFPNEKFRLDQEDGDPDKEARFWMLRKTHCPAILLENFFHTNPRECQEILMTEEGQDKIVEYIVNAIKHIEENGL